MSIYTKDFDSAALNEVKELIDITYIGTIIGAGFQSIIIKPYNLFKKNKCKDIENYSLVITKEKEKYSLLKKMLNKKVKKIKQKELNEDEIEIYKMLSNFGWNLFYIEKMEPYEFNSNSKFFKVFYNISKDTEYLLFNKKNISYQLENIKTYIKEYNAKEKGIYMAIKKAFTSLKNSNISGEFQLDIHSEQFVKFENKIICIDPVLFNYEELRSLR